MIIGQRGCHQPCDSPRQPPERGNYVAKRIFWRHNWSPFRLPTRASTEVRCKDWSCAEERARNRSFASYLSLARSQAHVELSTLATLAGPARRAGGTQGHAERRAGVSRLLSGGLSIGFSFWAGSVLLGRVCVGVLCSHFGWADHARAGAGAAEPAVSHAATGVASAVGARAGNARARAACAERVVDGLVRAGRGGGGERRSGGVCRAQHRHGRLRSDGVASSCAAAVCRASRLDDAMLLAAVVRPWCCV
jgi:hypothetical protein